MHDNPRHRKEHNSAPLTPTEATRAFTSLLAAAKRRTRFIHGREAAAFARELRCALLDLKEGLNDPRKGVDLVARFYRADEALFNMCDDSNGDLGDVFRMDARDLFVHYASACDDKQWLADLVLQLQHDNNYGVRDHLIDVAAQYLPESVIRNLIEQVWSLGRGERTDYRQRSWLHLIQSLASQLHDPELYERATRTAWPELGTAACIDVAGVYFQSGNAQTALAWLEKIPLDERFEAGKRDELLLAVYQNLGDMKAAADTAWRIFKRFRHEETFEQLLKVVGAEKRQQILDEETEHILQSPGIVYADANFLIWCGRLDEVETYLLARAAELNGNHYYSILPLAEAMEREERFLAATIVYRALLESILARAISKYYSHGVRYLRKLDELAPLVNNWRAFTPHTTYFLELLEKHKWKSSFWERYEAKGKSRASTRRDRVKV